MLTLLVVLKKDPIRRERVNGPKHEDTTTGDNCQAWSKSKVHNPEGIGLGLRI